MEKEDRVVYNPFILQLLYQRVVYWARLEQVLLLSSSCKEKRRKSLVRDNFRELSIVQDLVHLLREGMRQRIQFQASLYCFEEILFGAFILFFPTKRVIPENLCPFNDSPLTNCEDYLLLILHSTSVLSVDENEREELNRECLSRSLLQFLSLQYDFNQENYALYTRERVTLFFQLKESTERKAMGEDSENTIDYGREEITALLYLLLLNELITLKETHHTESLQSVHAQTMKELFHGAMEERLAREEKEIAFIQLCYNALLEYYVLQLSCNYHTSPSLPSPSPNVPICGSGGGEMYRIVNTDRKDQNNWILLPKSKEHLTYLKLQSNQHQYHYIVRRFIFDHHLRLSHDNKCLREACRLCHYFDSGKAIRNLSEFYAIVETRRGDECRVYLESLIVDRLENLDSLIFKNAWQVVKLMDRRIALFHLIGVHEMLHHIKSHYEQYEGEGVYRCGLILNEAKSRSRTGTMYRVEEWQKKLALDQDIFQLLYSAICQLLHQISKVGRVVLLSGHNKGNVLETCSELITTELAEIFLFYQSILSQTMK